MDAIKKTVLNWQCPIKFMLEKTFLPIMLLINSALYAIPAWAYFVSPVR